MFIYNHQLCQMQLRHKKFAELKKLSPFAAQAAKIVYQAAKIVYQRDLSIKNKFHFLSGYKKVPTYFLFLRNPIYICV